MEHLASSDAARLEWRRELAVAREKQGDISQAEGGFSAALEAYTDSLTIRKALVAKNPENPGWARDLMISFNKVGDAMEAAGDLEGARFHFNCGRDVIEGLVAKHPAHYEWQIDHATSWNRLGGVAEIRGDYAEMLRCNECGLEIIRRLAEKNPSNPAAHIEFGVFHYNVAVAAHRAGDKQKLMWNLNEADRILGGLESTGNLPATGQGRDVYDMLNRLAAGG
jgi:tetratricopeptide (TPR) repeat protein